MEPLVLECLRCGSHRQAEGSSLRRAATECPRCGYVGWAYVGDMSDRERRVLHALPRERRRAQAPPSASSNSSGSSA
jgi:predicted  nucleic acid-binding Zn-ribbon protein